MSTNLEEYRSRQRDADMLMREGSDVDAATASAYAAGAQVHATLALAAAVLAAADRVSAGEQ